MDFLEINGDDLAKIFHELHNKKKPAVKISDLSPEFIARTVILEGRREALSKALKVMKSKYDAECDRFWADVKDFYKTHDRHTHVYKGALYEGHQQETNHEPTKEQ